MNPLRQVLLLAALLVALLATPHALGANELIVGVITSRATAAGAAQTLVATGWAAQLRAAGGVFGVPVRLLLADDGGSVDGAVAQAQAQVDAGALAIVCCTTPASTKSVAELVEAAGVTLLAPSAWLNTSGSAYWAFTLTPTDTDAMAAIVADAYRRGRTSIAIMAPDLPITEAAASDLEALTRLVGIAVVSDTRYPQSQSEVTPEALLVASKRPGAVVVWGAATDIARAADALERRGYEGDVYARAATLYPGGQPPTWRSVADLLFPVPPAAVVRPGSATATVLPGEREGGALGTCAGAAARDAARIEASTGSTTQALAAAPVLGGLDLLEAAFEQLLALQIPQTGVAVMRQALRDTLVGLPVHCSGAGALDLQDGKIGAVLPRSLAIARATPTGLVVR